MRATHIDIVTEAGVKATRECVHRASLLSFMGVEALEFGTVLTVDGYQAKNGSNRVNGSSVTFRDGRKLFVGGSNPDIPADKQ